MKVAPEVAEAAADWFARLQKGDTTEQDFEVISVSVDREKDRQKFIEMVKQHEVSWPQAFDGRGMGGEFARVFTVNAVPAMFLLDQKGLLVSTDARGEKLETEVRRLLAR